MAKTGIDTALPLPNCHGYGPVYNDETLTKKGIYLWIYIRIYLHHEAMTREEIRTPLPARTDAEEHVSWSHFMT